MNDRLPKAGEMGTSMAVLVREYRSQDAPLVRRCIVELQDFERAIDPRLRPGDSMADAYWDQLQARCATKNGRVFVGEVDGTYRGIRRRAGARGVR